MLRPWLVDWRRCAYVAPAVAAIVAVLACENPVVPDLRLDRTLSGTFEGTWLVSVQDTVYGCYTTAGCWGNPISDFECPVTAVVDAKGDSTFVGSFFIALPNCAFGNGTYNPMTFAEKIEFSGFASQIVGENISQVRFVLSSATGDDDTAFEEWFGCTPDEPWDIRGSGGVADLNSPQSPKWFGGLIGRVTDLPFYAGDMFVVCSGERFVLSQRFSLQRP